MRAPQIPPISSRTARLLWSRLAGKLRAVEGYLAVHIPRNFGAFRDYGILPVHEKKERSSRPNDKRRSHNRTCHCTRMASAFRILRAPKSNLFAVHQTHVIDCHVQFAAPCHPFLRLRVRHSSVGYRAPFHQDHIIYLKIVKNLEVDSLARFRIGG